MGVSSSSMVITSGSCDGFGCGGEAVGTDADALLGPGVGESVLLRRGV